MSLVQEILYIVSNYPGGYRLIYDLLYDSRPPGYKPNKDRLYDSSKSTLSRLRRRGLVRNNAGVWDITAAGKKYLESKHVLRRFNPKIQNHLEQKRKLIVIFDIPEKKKKYRDWLRSELVGFGFTMIQKSVWFGPRLPKDFIEYIEENGLIKHIRFFKALESDLV